MVNAIKRYDELLVAAVSGHGGRVLSLADGSSFSVFGHPSDALGAVLELQRSVSTLSWGKMGRLPVTAAVHTGEAEMVDGSIFGPVLHNASRLAQAAYGGQVVVSASTAELARDGLPAGCELLDLGHWSLSDVPRPLHAYELRHRELGPAVRVLRAGRPGTGTLPMPSTSFVGRDAELVELVRLVDQAPIVTLTGVGGVGKTRLAVHFAAIEGARFTGGTWFCDLSAAATGDEVVERLAAALGLRAASTSELRGDLSDWLRFSEALLIVDNCEHVAASVAAELAPMLREGGLAQSGLYESPCPGAARRARHAGTSPSARFCRVASPGTPRRPSPRSRPRRGCGGGYAGPVTARDRRSPRRPSAGHRAGGAAPDRHDADRAGGSPESIVRSARGGRRLTAAPGAPSDDRLVVRAALADARGRCSPPCRSAREGSDWSWPRLSGRHSGSMTARWRTPSPICGISPSSGRRDRSPGGPAIECSR